MRRRAGLAAQDATPYGKPMTTQTSSTPLRSMTGFASIEGTFENWTWSAELRSVNAKGFDLRLRIPDWIEGLEAGIRAAMGDRLKRGNVTLSLRLSRGDAASAMALNTANLEAVLGALTQIEDRAMATGLTLAPMTAADLAGLKGVLEPVTEAAEDTTDLRAALLADAATLASALDEMRLQEGASLDAVLKGQIDEIEHLTTTAKDQAEARKADVAQALRDNLAKVMDGAAGADADRVAQELALLAVKSDVTEEIDRLHAHVAAARGLLQSGQTVGRKLDFLMQEFNREANTLCSKSQNVDLTQTGLALKAVIDQMREQVQNVE